MYRFSPVQSGSELEEIWIYLTHQLEALSQQLLNTKLPVTILKVFAHYPDEYEFLFSTISAMGKPAPFNSDTSYYVSVDKIIGGYNISHMGVRTVDPYRLHVGCGDYEVANFEEVKGQYVGKSPYVRLFAEDMIELWHPEFDVLGYIIPEDK